MQTSSQRHLRRFTAVRWAGILLIVSMVVPSAAHAYIDPLSGSILLQVLAAAVVAGTFTVKRWWHAVVTVARSAWNRLSR